VNNEKKGTKNYIGGNCLMEMGMAHVNFKKIFLLNNIPDNSSYLDEIIAMDPICLNGELKNIKKHA
jgi:predicted RNA-binding protein with PUA domain